MESQKWMVQKRFSEFEALFSALKKKYPSMPKLPPKQLMKLNKEGIEKRRVQLESLLRDMIGRGEIKKDPNFRDFLQIDEHLEIKLFTPKIIGEIEELPIGVRDFKYLKEENVLLITLCEMKIASRLDAYLTNVTFPWDKKSSTHVTVGALICYFVEFDETRETFKFTRTWVKSYPNQTNVIYYNKEIHSVAVGLDNGRIHLHNLMQGSYSVVDEVSQYSYLIQDLEIKPHNRRVMGLYMQKKYGYLYSIGADQKLKISDYNSREVVYEISIGAKQGLTSMLVDEAQQRMLISDSEGKIFFYSIEQYPPKYLHQIQSTSRQYIKAMTQTQNEQYLFTGHQDGGISVLTLGKLGNEKNCVQIRNMLGKSQARSMAYHEGKKELIVGNQNGFVSIWNPIEGECITVFQVCEAPITSLSWVEDKKYLMVGSKDKRLRIFKFPSKWTSKEVGSAVTQQVSAFEEEDQLQSLPNQDYLKQQNDSEGEEEEEQKAEVIDEGLKSKRDQIDNNAQQKSNYQGPSTNFFSATDVNDEEEKFDRIDF